jgi:hypothetical protein
VLILAGALTGFFVKPVRKREWAGVFLVAISIALGMGYRLPMLGPIIKGWFPFSYFRHSGMWLALADFGLAWLGAVGLEKIRRLPWSGAATRVALAWIAVAVILAGSAWHGGLFIRRSVWLLHPAVMLVTGGFVLLFSRGRSGKAGHWALAGLVCADLVWCGFRLRPSVPADWVMNPTEPEGYLAQKASEKMGTWFRIIRWPVSAYPGARDDEAVWGRDTRELVRNLRGNMQPNVSAASGLRSVDGDNPLVPNRIREFLSLISRTGGRMDQRVLEMLKLLGVRFVVSRDRVGGVPPPVRERNICISEVGGGRPRAWLEPADGGVLEMVEEPGPGCFRARCSAGADCILVLNEAWIRGWRAMIDGRTACVNPDHGFLVSVPVPHGRHRVEVVYDPFTVKAGLFASFVVLVAAFMVAVMSERTW